jgi:hypothetical protein
LEDFEMYEPGKLTVLLNESNSVLNTGMKNKSGGGITLHPRKGRNFFDIESECSRDTIDAFLTRLEEWTSEGLISWHPKGSKPVRGVARASRFVLPAAGETKTAPPNRFDDAINELNKKQKKDDEKTRVQQAGQDRRGTQETEPGVYGEPGGVTASRMADPAKHEVDAGRLGMEPDPFAKWETGQVLEHAVKFDVITKSGNYFRFGEETLGHGFKKACSRLEQDTELMERIKVRLPAPQ